MKEDPAILDAPEAKTFLATSPPAVGSMRSPPTPISPLTAMVRERHSSFASVNDSPARSSAIPVQNGTALRRGSQSSEKAFISQVGILPSSMPTWWNAHMEALRSGKTKDVDEPTIDKTLDNAIDHGSGDKVQSPEAQAETARRLKPPGRGSTTALYGIQDHPDRTAAAASQKKEKKTKFQFGIRSKSNPSEAMLVIYSTLRRLGGEWERMPSKKVPAKFYNPAKDVEFHPRREASADASHAVHQASSNSRREGSRGRGRDQDGEANHLGEHSSHESDAGRSRKKRKPNDVKIYEVPLDPWLVRARFRKQGMAPPGVAVCNSSRSSLANLTELSFKRDSGTAAITSGSSSRPSSDPANALQSTHTSQQGSLLKSATANIAADPSKMDACYVRMDIQIYTIPESKNYVVDFRCPGYGRIEAGVNHGEGKTPVSKRESDLKRPIGSRDFAQEIRNEQDGQASASTATTTGSTDQDRAENSQLPAAGIGSGAAAAAAIISEQTAVNEGGRRNPGKQNLQPQIPSLVPSLSPTKRDTRPEESITSPFPFLEVACQMIESLASAG